MMTTVELISNLTVLAGYFQDMQDKAETTAEYTEYMTAVQSLAEAIHRIEMIANFGHYINVVARMGKE